MEPYRSTLPSIEICISVHMISFKISLLKTECDFLEEHAKRMDFHVLIKDVTVYKSHMLVTTIKGEFKKIIQSMYLA